MATATAVDATTVNPTINETTVNPTIDETTVNPTIDPTKVDPIFTPYSDGEKIIKLYQNRVLELYQKESKVSDYKVTNWKVADGGKQDAPDGTAAVVINTGGTGSIRVFERNNRHLRGVQHKTQIAIIPWNSNWQFMAIGKFDIRFITKSM